MPDTLIPHPVNDTFVFGRVIEKKVKGVLIPGGEVFLKRGKHGARGGFGALHIWARHEAELVARGYAAEADVASYVAHIVRPGSPIFCEFAHIRDVRVTVVRTASGIAILEYKTAEQPHYSVVTAFAGRNAHGVRIGSIEG